MVNLIKPTFRSRNGYRYKICGTYCKSDGKIAKRGKNLQRSAVSAKKD